MKKYVLLAMALLFVQGTGFAKKEDPDDIKEICRHFREPGLLNLSLAEGGEYLEGVARRVGINWKRRIGQAIGTSDNAITPKEGYMYVQAVCPEPKATYNPARGVSY